MPNKDEHLQQVQSNKKTIDFLLTEIEQHSDWITTIAFYTALHLIEAVFFHDPTVQNKHGTNHETRRLILKTTPRYEKIYRHYRPLWNASLVARYLVEPVSSKETTFKEYLSPQEVQEIMLNHHLAGIQTSASRFLSHPISSKKKTKKKK